MQQNGPAKILDSRDTRIKWKKSSIARDAQFDTHLFIKWFIELSWFLDLWSLAKSFGVCVNRVSLLSRLCKHKLTREGRSSSEIFFHFYRVCVENKRSRHFFSLRFIFCLKYFVKSFFFRGKCVLSWFCLRCRACWVARGPRMIWAWVCWPTARRRSPPRWPRPTTLSCSTLPGEFDCLYLETERLRAQAPATPLSCTDSVRTTKWRCGRWRKKLELKNNI